jgi:hypothetical protein
VLMDVLDEIVTGSKRFVLETQTKIAEQLRTALNEHVPRPYSGRATILVNSSKAHKIVGPSTFWQEHLAGFDHQICGDSHHELFRDKLKDTARFVSRNLG